MCRIDVDFFFLYRVRSDVDIIHIDDVDIERFVPFGFSAHLILLSKKLLSCESFTTFPSFTHPYAVFVAFLFNKLPQLLQFLVSYVILPHVDRFIIWLH